MLKKDGINRWDAKDLLNHIFIKGNYENLAYNNKINIYE